MTSNITVLEPTIIIPSLPTSPAEVILAIADHLASQNDIIHLSSVSRYFRAVLSHLAFRRKVIYFMHTLEPRYLALDQLGPQLCPPTIRPFLTDLVLRLDCNHIGNNYNPVYCVDIKQPHLVRRRLDEPPAGNFEGISSLSLVFPRESGPDSKETDAYVYRQRLFYLAILWLCRSSAGVSLDSLTVDGADVYVPYHLLQCKEVDGLLGNVSSYRLVAYSPSMGGQDLPSIWGFYQTWLLPAATSLQTLELISDHYLYPVRTIAPRLKGQFERLRQLTLSRIMFSSNSPCFLESVIVSDEVAASLEELTLIRCPLFHCTELPWNRTWASILTSFMTKLRRLKMFRVEKKLGYKLLGFLDHIRRSGKEDSVYQADVEALLQLWAKIGQTPRFVDRRRLIHLFD